MLLRLCLVLVALLVVATATAALRIALYEPGTPPARADAAIVLGAAVWQDRPSPVFEERIRHGVRLVMEGAADYLILTGGVGAEGGRAESDVARQYAIATGVPAERILTESVSRVTAENLAEACALMKRHSLESALLVSDPLHMRRAMALADDIGLHAHASPTPTSRYRSWNTRAESLAYETFFYLALQARRLAGLGPRCAM